MDDETEDLLPRTPGEKTISIQVFLGTIACCVLALLGLELGLGLGLHHAPSQPPSLEFGHSDVEALPPSLGIILAGELVDMTELDMRTGFAVSTNPIVREYEFNITQATAAPDGFYKPMILVNGQSPGPLVEANTGDTIRVRVNNQMANTSTAIHWHGIDQRNTTWMDGVVGVSQCAIPPGHNFTYEFRVVNQRGTFWYHAHQSVQYTDGLFGPIIIHDPGELVPEVDDEKIVFIGDHYHTYGGILVKSYLKASSEWTPDDPGVEPLPDNFLLNGQNTYNCSVVSSTYPPIPRSDQPSCTGGQLYSTRVTSGQSIRFRLINHSSYMAFWFSIDNHTLEIVEMDGVEVQPIASRGVYVNIGQRYSVIVKANQTSGNYYLRATLPQTCFTPYCPYTSAGLDSIGYQVRGVLSYDETAAAEEPIGTAGNTSNPYGVDRNAVRGDVWEGCDDMPFDIPVPMREMAALDVSENNMHSIIFQFRQAGEVNRIFINRTAWSPYRHTAQLWQALDQEFLPGQQGGYNNWDFRLDQQVLLIPDANQGAQVVINSLDVMEHPFHMHFQIVGWGPGLYSDGDGATTTWNLANPMRRDTVTVPAGSHVVLRFEADNPGIWALHCHVAWHMEGGMFVSFIERPDNLKELVEGMDARTREVSEGFCSQSP